MYHQVVPAQYGFGAFLAIVHPSNVPFQFQFICSRKRFVTPLQCAVQLTLTRSRGQKYHSNEVVEKDPTPNEDLSLLAHHKCAVPSAGHGHAVARALSFQDPSPLGQRSCSSACFCAARPLPPADNGGLPQQALRQPQLANAPPSASACRTGAEGRRRSLQRLGALLLWFSRFVTPA